MPEQVAGTRAYEVGRIVNRGGMGAILEARQTSIQRTVAMKVMLGETSEDAMARFIEEARITGQLEHPNIVPVHEIGIDEHQHLYYTMKFVNGVTLQDALSRLNAFDPEALDRFSLAELLNIFQKVCDAVAFAHSKGVIHRDLKPSNVMIGDFGEALVVDWGLAKQLSQPSEKRVQISASSVPSRGAQTLKGAVIGTPSFMSPEQARGDPSKVDKRSDIYALGAILYAVLYLSPPIAGKNLAEILGNARIGRIEPGADKLPHVPGGRAPESLQAVVRKATALKPEDRYQSVSELQAEVTAYQRGFATRAENATLWKQLTLAIRRYKREVGLVALALLVLVGLGAYSFARVTRERNRAKVALRELAGAAPAFATQARSYALAGKFKEAIERLDYALKLDPGHPEFLLAKANLLQACLEFEQAAPVYRSIAGKLGPLAEANAALSERLALEQKQNGSLSKASLAQLFEIMVQEQRPACELMPMSRLLGRERELALQYWTQRLREVPFALDPPLESRLTSRPDGTLKLDLSATAISDLSILSEMPLGELDLSHCRGVADLTPLKEVPLVSLDVSHTSITDLSPVRGCPLRSLSIRGCAVTEISSLQNLPLLALDASQTEIKDFSPLAGTMVESLVLEGCQILELGFVKALPLKVLRLDNSWVGGGFAALPTLPFLEILILPQNWLQLPAEEVSNIRKLSARSNLKRISDRPAGRSVQNVQTSEEFWKDWSPDLLWIERLLRGGAKPKLAKLGDHSWQIDLHDGPIDEISALAGVRISHLDISTTLIKDLTPLTGAPLTYLDLRNTPVESLEALRGMHLRTLYLYKTQVSDFAPLSTLHDLELLDVSGTAFSDLSILNAPHLTELRLGSTLVCDLSPLSRFPLQRLHCDSIKVTSLEPLLKVPTLVWLIPPKYIPDVTLLKALPNLKRISYDWHPGSEPTTTPDKFWLSDEVIALEGRQSRANKAK
jgi:Leucine-rich repeat (LRR) protein